MRTPTTRSPLSRFLAALLAVAVPALPTTLLGVVDDAHSYTMEAATPFVSQGFKIRSDYWNGRIAPGGQKAIRHQLFKGNEYCFFIGCDVDGAELTIKVYLPDGTPAKATEVTDSNNAKAIRLPATTTGNYIIVFGIGKANLPADEPVSWALSYGYR
jgi:hypothetical protein